MMPNFDVLRHTGQKLQYFLNEINRELFMWNWDVNRTLRTVIDDDKHHFDMKTGSNKIKKSRLARDNSQGIELHIAETTSINFVLGTEFERANDATYSSTLIFIRNIFSPSGATAMLNHAQVHMDRGHCAHTALFFLLGSRTFICGIHLRTKEILKRQKSPC